MEYLVPTAPLRKLGLGGGQAVQRCRVLLQQSEAMAGGLRCQLRRPQEHGDALERALLLVEVFVLSSLPGFLDFCHWEDHVSGKCNLDFLQEMSPCNLFLWPLPF